MNTILMWVGIALIVIGWLALAWQAGRWMSIKNEIDKFPQKKQQMMLRRNYCRFTIIGGILLLILSIAVG